MSFTVEWSLISNPVPLDTVSRITGASHEYIKDLYRDGALGPVSDPSMAGGLHLYHLASLFVMIDANKKQINRDQIRQVLPVIAGAAFIQLQLTEVAEGHCIQRRGTPKLIHQLWTLLRSAEAKAHLEERLLGGRVQTHRYAWFDSSGCSTGDNLSLIEGSLDSWKTIDAWEIALQMKRELPGNLFAANIE